MTSDTAQQEQERLVGELNKSIETTVATEILLWETRAQFAASQCEVWHLKLTDARRIMAAKQSEHALLIMQRQPTGA